MKESKLKAREILQNLKLWEHRKKNPNKFSSGMKKKVLLAQALIADPDILVLDEPAANLDPTARVELFNDLLAVKEQGKTVLICSHILTELQEIADEITILNYGKIAFTGPIINKKMGYYQIIVSNETDAKNIAGLIKTTTSLQIVKISEKSVVVKLNDVSSETEQISKLAFKASIIVSQITLYVSNVSEIYDKVVFAVNKEFGTATALTSGNKAKKKDKKEENLP